MFSIKQEMESKITRTHNIGRHHITHHTPHTHTTQFTTRAHISSYSHPNSRPTSRPPSHLLNSSIYEFNKKLNRNEKNKYVECITARKLASLCYHDVDDDSLTNFLLNIRGITTKLNLTKKKNYSDTFIYAMNQLLYLLEKKNSLNVANSGNSDYNTFANGYASSRQKNKLDNILKSIESLKKLIACIIENKIIFFHKYENLFDINFLIDDIHIFKVLINTGYLDANCNNMLQILLLNHNIIKNFNNKINIIRKIYINDYVLLNKNSLGLSCVDICNNIANNNNIEHPINEIKKILIEKINKIRIIIDLNNMPKIITRRSCKILWNFMIHLSYYKKYEINQCFDIIKKIIYNGGDINFESSNAIIACNVIRNSNMFNLYSQDPKLTELMIYLVDMTDPDLLYPHIPNSFNDYIKLLIKHDVVKKFEKLTELLIQKTNKKNYCISYIASKISDNDIILNHIKKNITCLDKYIIYKYYLMNPVFKFFFFENIVYSFIFADNLYYDPEKIARIISQILTSNIEAKYKVINLILSVHDIKLETKIYSSNEILGNLFFKKENIGYILPFIKKNKNSVMFRCSFGIYTGKTMLNYMFHEITDTTTKILHFTLLETKANLKLDTMEKTDYYLYLQEKIRIINS